MAPRNPSIIGLANDMPFIINASDSVFLSQSIVFSGLHWLSHCGSLSLSLINNGFAMLCYAKIRIVRVCVVEARGRLDDPSVDGQAILHHSTDLSREATFNLGARSLYNNNMPRKNECA